MRAEWLIQGFQSRLRRFGASDVGYSDRSDSWEVDEFVEAEHDLAKVGEGQLSCVLVSGVGSGLGVEEGPVVGKFGRGRVASESAEIELPDGGVRVGGIEFARERSGPLDDLEIVHEEKGLRSNGGTRPAALTGERFGLVENLHHGDEAAALDHKVDTAAAMAFVEGAGAKHLGVQLSGGSEDGITNNLGFQSTRSEAPEKFVVGVDGCFLGRGVAALKPGRAEEDVAVE